MDEQAAEIERDIEGAKVERVGEGIKITFSSGILFDVDKSDLKGLCKSELTELSRNSSIFNLKFSIKMGISPHDDEMPFCNSEII
jgi:hypothetical protein